MGTVVVVVALGFPDAFQVVIKENLLEKKELNHIRYDECSAIVTPAPKGKAGILDLLIPALEMINEKSKAYASEQKNNECFDNKIKRAIGYANYDKQDAIVLKQVDQNSLQESYCIDPR